jgi:hypothetical protein
VEAEVNAVNADADQGRLISVTSLRLYEDTVQASAVGPYDEPAQPLLEGVEPSTLTKASTALAVDPCIQYPVQVAITEGSDFITRPV